MHASIMLWLEIRVETS